MGVWGRERLSQRLSFLSPEALFPLPSCLSLIILPQLCRGQDASGSNLSLPTSFQNIFAWCGAKSNILERNKARDLALAIRDGERQGKAHVEIVTDGEEPANMIQVLGPKPSLKEGNPEEDLTADRTNAQAAALYKVSDATGQMNLTKLADSSPFALELLIPDDCFVLDNGLCGKIYIWKGRKANERERQAALQVAEDFITRMRYAPNTQVRSPPCASTPSS